MSEQYLAAFTNERGHYLVMHSEHVDYLEHLVHRVLCEGWEDTVYQRFDSKASLEKYLEGANDEDFVSVVDVDKKLV